MTTTTIAGEFIDFGPREGDLLAVVGVAFDDVLNVRSGPHHTTDIVATLAPTQADFTARGQAWMPAEPGAFWYLVRTLSGTEGWVNSRFVAQIGFGEDATEQVVDDLGEPPVAETLTDLANLVAGTLVPLAPPPDVIVVAAPVVGDVNTITVDVIGLQDDAQLGLRLEITASEHDSGEAFVLETVTATALCGRGVDEASGFCV